MGGLIHVRREARDDGCLKVADCVSRKRSAPYVACLLSADSCAKLSEGPFVVYL